MRGRSTIPPSTNCFTPGRGGGAFLNGAPIRVSATPNMRAASDRGRLEHALGAADVSRHAEPRRRLGFGVIRSGSGALALAYVAAGRSDAFIEHQINAWDCLAGNVIVTEAGGYVNDFLARDGLRKGNALLACTPALREALTEIAALEGVTL